MAGYELDRSMIGAAIYLLLNSSYVISIDSLFKKGQKPKSLFSYAREEVRSII